MLDGILNNRKEWNAKKEEYEAKLKAIEEQKAAKAPATAGKRCTFWDECVSIPRGAMKLYLQKGNEKNCLVHCLRLAPANNPSGGGSGSKTCSVC